MARYHCPTCTTVTHVDVPTSSHMLGSGPPLTIRFDCQGCDATLNATTDGKIVWRDRPPRAQHTDEVRGATAPEKHA